MTSLGENHTAPETVRTNITSRRQFMRRAVALGLAIPSMSALLAACEINIGVDDDDDVADEPAVEPDEDDVGDEVEPDDDHDVADEPDDDDEVEPDDVVEVPELDLETLEAETPDGLVQAERAENSFVGEIGDGRVIGIASLSDIGAARDTYDHDTFAVYLYDRQEMALMLGELDDQGATTLQSEEHSDFEASVELTREDDKVTGTVTFGNEEPASFIAEPATGSAGIYWAVNEGADSSCDWMVLPDGRQWGCVCRPPIGNACCELGRVF